MKKIGLGVLAVAVLAGSAFAQETVNIGSIDSGGNVLGSGTSSTRGEAGIPTFTYTFTNSFLWGGNILVNGTLTSAGINSFGNEASFRIDITGHGGSAAPDYVPFGSTNASYTTLSTPAGGQALFATGYSGVPFNLQGLTATIRFYESYNDGGANSDAAWSNLSLLFGAYAPPAPPAGVINLGTISPGPFNLNTGGSGFDTEMALYDSNGVVLAQDDDSFGNAESSLTGQNLADGTYYVAVTRYVSGNQFGSGFSVTGTGAAAIDMLHVGNGATTLDGSGALAAGGVTWYSFSVPTPGAAALLGLGGLAAARRRRV